MSDEFTVPLCAIHHHHIHTTGKEREWWQERNIDPLVVAGALWRQSTERRPVASKDHLNKISGMKSIAGEKMLKQVSVTQI